MGAARILILLVAALAGGAAFFLMSTDQTAEEVVAQAIPAPKDIEMVKVLVADAEILRGGEINDKNTKWIQWPKKSVPEFYITDDHEDFLAAMNQMRATRPIRPTEPINDDNTVRPGDRGMLAAIMNPGMRAITARVAAETSAGGFILPGDRVDVYASGELQDPDVEIDANVAVMLLDNVRVLAIDQAVQTEEDENALVGRTVTLEVRPELVEPFLAAREDATITLVLRSIFEGSTETVTDLPTPEEVIVLRYGQG